MSATIRVFLADDQALVRSGFRMLIEAEDDLEVVGEAPDGAATLRELAAQAADEIVRQGAAYAKPISNGATH